MMKLTLSLEKTRVRNAFFVVAVKVKAELTVQFIS